MITRTLTGRKSHVWSQDPAIDRDHPSFSWDAFLKDGDLKHLPKVEGQEYTLFEIGPLTRRQMMRVMSLSGMEQVNEAVAFGLKDVKNYVADGQSVSLEHQNQGDEKRLNQRSLDRIFDPLLFTELGMRIIMLSQLDPLSSRGSS